MDQMKIYRDDDINYLTCADELKRIHEPFRRHGVIHTVAVEMYRIWENKSLFHFLKTDPLINVELHGWRHDDFEWLTTFETEEKLSDAMAEWERHARPHNKLKTITTFFPPWNKIHPEVTLQVCTELGLIISMDRTDYAWHFHYWEVTAEDVDDVLSGRMTGKEKQKQVKIREAVSA